MCGFGGIINSKELVQRDKVMNVAQQVNYRGPDATGVLLLDKHLAPAATDAANHALFFNRLAIVDLNKRSDQPFTDGRYILLFNGEIYNYKTLRGQLEESGSRFHTSSDTEVLFEALKQWGVEALRQLNGMFAFAFIDQVTQEVLLARDRLGIKPQYYSVEDHTLCFASESDSILRLQGRSPEVDATALQAYLWLQYIPAPRTIHQSVRKLPPGSYLKFRGGRTSAEKFSIHTYWDAYEQLQQQNGESGRSLRDLLADSLQLQIHADVPVGLFLSSGVDSSLLTAIIHHSFARDGKAFNLFTVAFDETTASDESEASARFVEGFGNPLLKHQLLPISARSLMEKVEQLYQVYDEPFADPAALLNWAISEKAGEQVTVVLSGDGADELFWGYDRYNLWRQYHRQNRKSPVLSGIKAQLNGWVKGKYNTVYTADPMQLHYNLLKMRELSGENPNSGNRNWSQENAELIRERDDLASLVDVKSYLPDAMLYKVDRSSMAASIEVRVPYLDNHVIDYALQLPLQQKSNATFFSKAVLKQLLLELAPHFPIHQQKKGFSMPLRKWLSHEWKSSVYEVLMNTDWEQFGIRKAKVDHLLKSFYQKGADVTREVWHLYNFGLWLHAKKTIRP